MPLLTVMAPAYNCASYLHECLESVLGQLQADCELVVGVEDPTFYGKRCANVCPRVRLRLVCCIKLLCVKGVRS